MEVTARKREFSAIELMGRDSDVAPGGAQWCAGRRGHAFLSRFWMVWSFHERL